ncbi:hypothetical protein SCP_0201320 [Sparassis crispa]|uniref:CCHC-type domain-containing protein n=1 Tax=Sparassis crispa TaxID=139825 RepID=A0A401G9U1_9APHY|nr:hypothetical protein SCP_0201320 [Sparassis crispa]GBE78935.1 hypothetical protein SCP_0201320 [Sparassis crispa]
MTAKVPLTEPAIQLLLKNKLIEDKHPNVKSLVQGLSLIAKSASKASAMVDIITAFAHYASRLMVEEAAGKLIEHVVHKMNNSWGYLDDMATDFTQLESKFELHVNRTEVLLQKLEAEHKNSAERASRLEQAVTKMIQTSEEIAKEHTNPVGAVPQPSGLTYAAAITQVLPTSHASTLACEDILASQILVDGALAKNASRAMLTEEELLAKAEMAYSLMGIKASDAPPSFAFCSCKKLRNGGVVYNMNSPTSAKWLRSTDIMKTFLDHFSGGNCQLKTHTYAIIAEFVPIACRPDEPHYPRIIESRNNYDPGDIESAQWIKPPERQSEGQCKAHLIIRFTNPKSANSALRQGLIIAGTDISARKLIPEPCRCLKCQKIGVPHFSADCKSIHDTCSKCASVRHRTADCQELDPTNYGCANCQAAHRPDWKGHAAWDRLCPIFLEEQKKMMDRLPESKYRFFPTADPTSWEQIHEVTPAHPMAHTTAFPARTMTSTQPSQSRAKQKYPQSWADDEPPVTFHFQNGNK